MPKKHHEQAKLETLLKLLLILLIMIPGGVALFAALMPKLAAARQDGCDRFNGEAYRNTSLELSYCPSPGFPENMRFPSTSSSPALFQSKQKEVAPFGISEKVIHHLISGPEDQAQIYGKIIFDLARQNTLVANYTRFVLTRFPGFKIVILPKSSIQGGLEISMRARYIPEIRVIILPELDMERMNASPYIELLRSCIRHEFMHAFNNAVHVCDGLYSKPGHATTIFIDYSNQQGAGWIERGNKRLMVIKKLLDKEQQGMLTEQEQARLAESRLLVPKTEFVNTEVEYMPAAQFFAKGYREQMIIGPNRDSLSVILYILEVQNGKIYYMEKPYRMSVAEDSLWELVTILQNKDKILAENSRTFYEEKTAYLFQYAPDGFIQKVYPELWKYVKSALSKTLCSLSDHEALNTASIQEDIYRFLQLDEKYHNGLRLVSSDNLPNRKEGVKLIKEAARGGNVDAQIRLILLYNEGKVVKQNLLKAYKWVKKAAEQGSAGAQFNLGEIYCMSDSACAEYGVKRDLGQAKEWLEKADAQGFPEAKSLLDTVNEELKGPAGKMKPM